MFHENSLAYWSVHKTKKNWSELQKSFLVFFEPIQRQRFSSQLERKPVLIWSVPSFHNMHTLQKKNWKIAPNGTKSFGQKKIKSLELALNMPKFKTLFI
jgi:hypothetical protein